MQLLVWKDSYSVGVKELDVQHQKIFELIDRLCTAIADTEEQKMADKIIEELENYSKFHFSTEEKYFDMFNYDEKEEHKAKHEKYKEKTEKFKSDSVENNPALLRDILDFMVDWWNSHIQQTDKRYAKCFQDHGLS